LTFILDTQSAGGGEYYIESYFYKLGDAPYNKIQLQG